MSAASRFALRWGGLAFVALAALALTPREREPERARGTLVERLLGPLAQAAAALQWVRYDRALAAGHEELALERARSALELDPRSVGGWTSLVQHLAFELGSAAREPDPHARARWWELALATAEEGEARASRPAELAFLRGLLLARVASLPPAQRPLPLGAREAWARAALAYERAVALGHPLAAEAAASAREREATAEGEGG